MSEPNFVEPTELARNMTTRTHIATELMKGKCNTGTWPHPKDYAEIARRSVALADALIAELSK